MAKKASNAKNDKVRKPPFAIGRLHSHNDPRVYAGLIQQPTGGIVRVAGLDLGTNCGIAFADLQPGKPLDNIVIVMGQWDLSLGPYDSGPLRHIRLKQFLTVLQPTLVMYEEVKYNPPKDFAGGRRFLSPAVVTARVSTAAEFLGGLKTTLAVWAQEHDIPAHGLSIGTIKKAATGSGTANKAEIIKATNEQFGTAFDPDTYEVTGADNICDAAWCCYLGIAQYGEGLTCRKPDDEPTTR